MMVTDREVYDDLCAYTLSHGDPSFIHQHVVDAYAAQHADKDSKPIGVTFALAGLYLHVERGLSGRQVQLAHMRMAKAKRSWPEFSLPVDRGPVTAGEVMDAPPGPERDREIHRWCASVWKSLSENRERVTALLKELGI